MSPVVMMKLVENKPGIKANELLVEYITNIREAGLEVEPTEQILQMLENLVKSGDLVEVEYVLPTMDYRIKSLYFPKGTTVSVVKAKDQPSVDLQTEAEEDPLVVELANAAVTDNLKEDGTAKYNTAQGYACAVSAIKLYRQRFPETSS